jgi:hypothetical protein
MNEKSLNFPCFNFLNFYVHFRSPRADRPTCHIFLKKDQWLIFGLRTCPLRTRPVGNGLGQWRDIGGSCPCATGSTTWCATGRSFPTSAFYIPTMFPSVQAIYRWCMIKFQRECLMDCAATCVYLWYLGR